jgi:hypothetical protein
MVGAGNTLYTSGIIHSALENLYVSIRRRASLVYVHLSQDCPPQIRLAEEPAEITAPGEAPSFFDNGI